MSVEKDIQPSAIEEVFLIVEEAQTLAHSDPLEFAKMSSAAGRIARDMGKLSLSEQAHRNALLGYQMVDPGTAIQTPDHRTLWEYEQLALTLSQIKYRPKAIIKLAKLKRELDSLGDVGIGNVIQGLTAMSEVEKGLSRSAYMASSYHGRKHRLIETIIQASLISGGLGLRALSRDRDDPRPISRWVKDLSINLPTKIV